MKFMMRSEVCEKNKGQVLKDLKLNPAGNEELLLKHHKPKTNKVEDGGKRRRKL